MQRLGFIHDMMDVKVLILFVAARASYPMTNQEIYELCYEDGRVYIKCSEADAVYLYTAGRRRSRTGEVKDGEYVTEASFEIKETDGYFRLTVKDKDGKYANTRAYFLDELK